ncbi:MAG: hypothetical protein AAFQ09_11185 [Pseudomonadota bacterium]
MKIWLLCACLASGCTALVPTTAMRLNGLSPTTADPADIAVDLKFPDGIDVSPGSARLSFSTMRIDTDETAAGDFALQRDGTVFRVAPADFSALRALQATARQWSDESPAKTNGSLSISLSPCRVGTGPAADASVSVAIQLEQGGAFLPLVRDGPLSAVTSEAQLRDMPDCT